MQNIKEFINQYRVSLLILGSFLAVLIIGVTFYSWQAKHRDLSPPIAEDEAATQLRVLQELQASSEPVDKTPGDRRAELEKLSKSSSKVSASTSIETQIEVLQALENQSN